MINISLPSNCSNSWISLDWIECSQDDENLSQSFLTCWQLIIISWIPFIFIFGALLHIGLAICRRSTIKSRQSSFLFISRLLVAVLLVTCFSILVFNTPSPLQSLIDGLVVGLLILLVLVILLQTWIISQITLLYFWIMLFFTRIPFLIYNTSNYEHGIINMIIIVLTVIGFILECLVPGYGAVKNNPSPEESCSHASILFYAWLDPLFWIGTKQSLGGGDIPHLQQSFSVKRILDKFTKTKMRAISKLKEKVAQSLEFDDYVNIKEDKEKKDEVEIMYILAKNYAGTFTVAAVMKLAQDLLKFAVPIVLKELISFIDKGDGECASWWEGYVLAFGLFLIGSLQAIVLQQYWRKTYRVALRARTILFSEIYKKALIVSPMARKDFTVGEIVSLMSSDAQTFKQVIPSLNMVWSMPLQIILSIYFLYQELGATVFAGVIVLVLLIPFNTGMGKLSQKYKSGQLSNKDKRIRKMYELLNSIKIIKLYAWEKMFQEKIESNRKHELTFLKKNAVVKALINFVFSSAPIIVTLVSFGAYVSSDPINNVLTPEKAFVCLTLFNMLKLPLNLLPNILTEIFRLRVSIKRVNKFLNCEEVNNYVGKLDPSKKVDIELKEASFAWGDGQTILNQVNMTVKHGDLALVTGSIGGGKSSMLSAILGQMIHKKGSVSIASGRTLAYVPQEAWLQNLTVRDNIIFGKKFDNEFYKKVLHGCALDDDLEILANGDQTVIGEQGVNLSGGQKQRIALARAVYSEADIVIMDDPLSAVDVHVCQHLVRYILGPSGMLKEKTRLMVTHNMGLTDIADVVFTIDQGCLSMSHVSDKKVVNEDQKNEAFDNENKVEQLIDVNNLSSGDSESVQVSKEIKDTIKVDKKDITSRLQDKSVASGSAFIRSYSMIIKSIGIHNFILFLVLFVINQALLTGSSIWLTYWSDRSVEYNSNDEQFDNKFYIGIYGALGLGTAICAFLRNLLLLWTGANGSGRIHNNMFNSIVRAKLGFLESTSSGSLISRFSGDLDAVDNTIPPKISAFLFNLFEVLGVVITISITSIYFLLAVIPIVIIFYGIKLFYVPTSRQLKRLESSSNAPIYKHFKETISGLASIKGFNQTSRFLATLEDLTTKNLTFSYYSTMCGRWLSLRTELVAQLLVLAAGLLAVANRDHLSSGWAGLIVTLALSITSTFNCLLNSLTALEDQATVAERIKEMIKHTPQEPDWSSDDPPGSDWPTKGHLVLENYSTGYDGVDDLVLEDINLSLNPSENVAIVGRTGAGKSSLALGLLRVLEPRGGKILIDGIDISTVGLHELRTAITIIPQDPVLFAGTLKQNICPENEHSDEHIRDTLISAQLSPEDDEGQIGGRIVEEGGANFSQGERQLVCLARAICKGSRLVIMDEATASVDEETDQLIQKTMRDQFADSTVVTIAHRLNTIMDYDRVVVLDNGKVVEEGNPAQLVSEGKGMFYMMVKE